MCIVKARKRKGRFVRSILMYSGTGFGSTGFGSTGFGSTGFQPVEGVPPGSGSIQEKGEKMGKNSLTIEVERLKREFYRGMAELRKSQKETDKGLKETEKLIKENSSKY